jgi:hypothetical protein
VKNKATSNQLIAILLPDAPMPTPYKTVKKQDKLGPPHLATLSYLYNLLKAICPLFSHFKLHQFPCPPLLYSLSGLQSILRSPYCLSIPPFTSYFYSTFQSSSLPLSLPSLCNFTLPKLLYRLSTCFLFTLNSIIFSAHYGYTLLMDCSLYCGALIFSYN